MTEQQSITVYFPEKGTDNPTIYVDSREASNSTGKKIVEKMKSGSVIVDVAIDQGGCVETSCPTTHTEPTFTYSGVVHYCVGNMPAAVPRTSTLALTNETLPYVLEIANSGFENAVRKNRALARGVNTHDGAIVHPKVAETFNLPYREL